MNTLISPEIAPHVVEVNSAHLETMVRRVVRSELVRLLRSPRQTVLAEWAEAEEQDVVDDSLLLSEALGVLQKYANKPASWLKWDEFEAELDRAEAAGELPA
jgi:hypothetical protein